MQKRQFLSAIALLLLSACGGGSGSSGSSGPTGASGSNGLSARLLVSNEAAGANCVYSGSRLDAGFDANANGTLDASEISSTQYVCQSAPGAPGAAGLSTLVQMSNEAAGAHCANPGKKVDAGLDLNSNGLLDASEITSTGYVCNGATGATGSSSLMSITPEVAGIHCASGGNKISTGLDSNGNNVLDTLEIIATAYTCNGSNGAAGSNGSSSLMSITPEVAGIHCANAGSQISTGLDSNANGTLDPAEISSTAYVCTGLTGAPGGNGTNGHSFLIKNVLEGAGSNCNYGGNKITSGLDGNDNGVLDAGEVAATSYVCHGAPGASLTWVNVTGASVHALSNTGYIANNGSAGVMISLPASPAIGDLVQVSGAGAWMLVPNGNQVIIQNMAGTGAVTGAGLGGSLGDSLVVQYIGNNTFIVISFVGSITSNIFFAQGGVTWTPPSFSTGYTWSEGTAYCASTSFGGLTGWRMPTASELLSIDAYGVRGTRGWPAGPGNIWTTDPDPINGTGFHIVEAFGYVVTGSQVDTNYLFVTCVR